MYCSHACRQTAYRRRNGQEHEHKLVTLVQADARSWLATLPDDSGDLIITNPPYKFERGNTHFRTWFKTIPDTEWPAVFAELHRVLRQNSHAYVFGDRRVQRVFDEAAHVAGFQVHPPLVWDKQSIGLGSGAWRSQHEFICFYEKGHRAPHYRNRGNVLRASRITRGYPTEKPIAILQHLITQSSDPGELILDPFCGSGNLGRAARPLGRRCLLCDIDATSASRRLRLEPIAPKQAKP